jgi:hypothetical protein
MNNQADDTVPAVPAVPSEARAEARQLTRAEAAVYLTGKGYKITKATLAKHATTHTGPLYIRDDSAPHHPTRYRQADLDAWTAAGGATAKARQNNAAKRPDDLATAVTELLPMIDRAMHGQGTFSDGMRFAETVEKVRKALARLRRANGTD